MLNRIKINILKRRSYCHPLGVREKKFGSFKHQTGTFDNNTKVLTATLNDGVLNEKAKTIVFPEVPNIFGVLPLYINSTDVPITYHYEFEW